MKKTVFWTAAIAVATSSLCSVEARTLPFEEYDKRIKSAQTVSPLTSELFGERISLYNGSTAFHVTDVSIPGNDQLPVALHRRLRVESLAEFTQIFGGFGNWDLDVPYIQGSYLDNWGSFSTRNAGRCTGFHSPPDLGEIKTKDYWSGVKLNLPGQGEQEILRIANLDGPFPKVTVPSDGHTYRLGTKDFHRIRCKLATANGFPGEGFIVLGPDGTTMTFDVGVTRHGGTIGKPINQGNYADAARTNVYLLVSSIVDKNGNSVSYSWAGDKLQSITSSDGRAITLGWTGNVITSVSAYGKAWTYGYSPYGQLERVGLPDGSAWSYNMLNAPPRIQYPFWAGIDASDPGCTEAPEGTSSGWVSIKHPSGAEGRFDFAAIRHRRSGVPMHACHLVWSDPEGIQFSRYELGIPDYFDTLSLTSKSVSGGGLPSGTWTYEYEIAEGRVHMSMSLPLPCQTCQKDKSVRVNNPDGTATEYRFGTLYEGNDGLLLGTYKRDANNTILRAERSEYVTPVEAQSMPFPEVYGYNLGGDDGSTVRIRPVKAVMLAEGGTISATADGVTSMNATVFNRFSSNFDRFGRPQQVQRASSLGYSATDTMAYEHLLGRWIVGLLKQKGTDGAEVERTDFNGMGDPERTYRFGKLAYTLGYGANGVLTSVTDGRHHTIGLADWYRGVPRVITHPGGVQQSATVDPAGWITSTTDELHASHGYGYDGMGRVSAVVYPTGDSTVWNNTHSEFRALTPADWLPPGISAGQWRQFTYQGNHHKATYFDALWRPVLALEYDAQNSGATMRSTRTAYDTNGNVVFQSYPVAGADPVSQGTRTQYDALDRPVSIKQDSEHGPLETTIQYLPGFVRRTTNPRNQSTTEWFQVFDTPTYDFPVRIEAPENTLTTIARDAWGKPLSITRGPKN